MSRRTGNRLVFSGVLALLAVPAASSWSPAAKLSMAQYALQLAPPDLVRQIERNEREYRQGVLDAVEMMGRGSSVQELVRETSEAAIHAIVEHRPFSEVAYRSGTLACLMATANDPLFERVQGTIPEAYRGDYARYLESARRRFAVLYYGDGRDIAPTGDLSDLITRTLERSREFAPMVDAEYHRIGAIDGVALFDDKSTAFGIGSLAFSHAVSDIVGALRYIWLRAGGIDTRGLPPSSTDRVILVAAGSTRH